ncbi:MAG: hypothetical protein JXC32_16255, partial [Anaerolineae bacterium]|nr:hypothetical protein [Anaerolineae bacterium]
MDTIYHANVLRKGVAFWFVFLAMYGIYRFFPVAPLCLVCGIVESNFQHYKAGFYAYLIVCLAEFVWYRRRIGDRESFIYSRLTATVFLPWIIFLLWYIAPALIGRWPNNTLEIVWANVITLIVGLATVLWERGLAQMPYSRALKGML